MGAEGFAAGGLQPSVEWDGEEAAEEADQRHDEHDGIRHALRQEPGDAVEFGKALSLGQPYQNQAEYGQTRRADGYQAQEQAFVAEFCAQHRAGGDADGE